MMTRPYATPPAATLRRLGWVAVGVLVAANLGILLISAGISDPIPAALSAAPVLLDPIHVTTTAAQLTWLATTSLDADLDARLTAAWDAGSTDTIYGLILGSPATYLAVNLSPTGYVSVSLHENNRQRDLMPLQTWPHVRRGNAGNEIQLTRQGENITIRINRERLWTGVIPLPAAGLGVRVQSFAPPATIRLETLQIEQQP